MATNCHTGRGATGRRGGATSPPADFARLPFPEHVGPGVPLAAKRWRRCGGGAAWGFVAMCTAIQPLQRVNPTPTVRPGPERLLQLVGAAKTRAKNWPPLAPADL